MAISAATQDFRFVSIKETELDELEVEISILSLPKELKLENKQDAIKLIKVGRDGLIIESDWQRGLLLPQVAVEQKWDSEQFLDNTCIKAGLHEGCWREKNTKIFFPYFYFSLKEGGVVCRKCKSKIRADYSKVKAGKVKCRKCGSKSLRPKRVKCSIQLVYVRKS